MRVFLCWSGERSRRLAVAFREWLPTVIQALHPWMSDEDLEKGVVWFPHVADELKQCSVGILFITPENLDSVWVHFEAGALSKTFTKEGYVCPYLLDIQPSQVKGPLTHFQTTQATEADTRRLVGTLNDAIGEEKLPAKTLDRTFNTFWPELNKELTRIREIKTAKKLPTRPESEVLEEILAVARTLATRQELEQRLASILSHLQEFSLTNASLPSGSLAQRRAATLAALYPRFADDLRNSFSGSAPIDYSALREALEKSASVVNAGDSNALAEAYRKGLAAGAPLVSGGDSSTLAEEDRRIGAELAKLIAKSETAKKGKPQK